MNTTDITAGRDLEALRAAIAGQVFVPGEVGYDQARQAWNLAVDQRPAVVVEAGSAADVAQAVRYARAHGIRIAPQGTGHGAGPLEPLNGAMLLRTTRMRTVHIDPAARTARAEAGAVWPDVTVPAAQHGLAALAGSSPNVGVPSIPSAAGWAGWPAATGWPPTASPRPSWSSRTATWSAPTPTTSRTYSGPCAAAAASAW